MTYNTKAYAAPSATERLGPFTLSRREVGAHDVQGRVAAARLRQAFVAAAARDNRYRLRRAVSPAKAASSSETYRTQRSFMAAATLRDVFASSGW
jgi:hypothetical protein